MRVRNVTQSYLVRMECFLLEIRSPQYRYLYAIPEREKKSILIFQSIDIWNTTWFHTTKRVNLQFKKKDYRIQENMR